MLLSSKNTLTGLSLLGIYGAWHCPFGLLWEWGSVSQNLTALDRTISALTTRHGWTEMGQRHWVPGEQNSTCLETWPISDGYFSLIIPEKLNWRTQETGWSHIPTCPQDPQKARVPPLGSQAINHLFAPGLGALLCSAGRSPSLWACSAGRSVQADVPPLLDWGWLLALHSPLSCLMVS